MTDFHQQIADLEAEIDVLFDAAQRCRKGMIVARVATVSGALLFAASLLGLIRPDPIILIIGIAAAPAGIGYYGSSKGSLDQIIGKLRVSEARRDEMIDGMELQPVQDC